ncbi:TMEM175 family protein [Micromonospora sp. WP24]|uniref:TMEM175 family protein n=1 Tax=Micromonospora sp. WP24 TaxID=2604469 RepID=UPI00210557B8|nr:TMEM175 family protein [Micromonospora sp. WP24]
MRAEQSGGDEPVDGAEYGVDAEAADRIVGGEMRSEIGRLLTFSDAVFAIVITLLVLELRAPEVPPGGLARALLDQWPSYLAYVTSYLLIAVTWYNHKTTFRRVHRCDPWLHVTNLGVLFSTALLPFATAVVSRSLRHGNQADERISTALFGLVGVMISISWLGLYHHLVRNRRLLRPGVTVRLFTLERRRGLFGVAAFGLGGLLGFLVSPPVALGIFLVLPVIFALSAESVAEVRHLRRR